MAHAPVPLPCWLAALRWQAHATDRGPRLSYGPRTCAFAMLASRAGVAGSRACCRSKPAAGFVTGDCAASWNCTRSSWAQSCGSGLAHQPPAKGSSGFDSLTTSSRLLCLQQLTHVALSFRLRAALCHGLLKPQQHGS